MAVTIEKPPTTWEEYIYQSAEDLFIFIDDRGGFQLDEETLEDIYQSQQIQSVIEGISGVIEPIFPFDPIDPPPTIFEGIFEVIETADPFL